MFYYLFFRKSTKLKIEEFHNEEDEVFDCSYCCILVTGVYKFCRYSFLSNNLKYFAVSGLIVFLFTVFDLCAL